MIFLAHSQVIGEAYPFSNNHKVKFYKIQCSMDYDMDNGFKVIRMMKLRDQQVGVYKGSDN